MAMRVRVGMCRVIMPLMHIAMRMSVSIVAMTFVSVRMGVTVVAVLMSVVMTTAALGYLNIKMSFLIAHGYIYCSVTGCLGSKFKMVHSTAMVGSGLKSESAVA